MKKSYYRLILCILLTFIAVGAIAQQGNVAAGGDATGTGGSMSYSIGQTDYLIYSSDQGSISLGLQQPFLYSPPLVLEIPNTTVSDGELLCFNAEQTVIVAGDGKHFIVEPNGHADIIAGHNIIIRHGTSVELSGSLHARISTDWCLPQQSLLASFYDEPQPIKHSFDEVQNTAFFKVYPNPTTGDFTLELFEVEEASLLLVEIYTMQGSIVLRREMPFEQRHTLSLAESQPGIYLIRVMKNNSIGIAKIIKQ